MTDAHPLRVVASAQTDRGRVREGNEDALYAGTSVFAVADGMGGHQAGEVASETALHSIREIDAREFQTAAEADRALRQAIARANATVVEKAQSDPSLRGMGTTLTAVLVRDGRLHVAHVGDSRAYLVRPGEGMSQLTTDHTLVEQLVQEGRIGRDEVATHPQRSVITRAIGVERDVEVDTLQPIQLRPGDQILLCSDGLTGPVEDHEIGDILAAFPDGNEACRRLIDAANERGGPDNITVVLLRAEGEGEGAGGRVETAEIVPVEAPRKADITITTRQESGRSWDPASMGRLGAPQGVPGADLEFASARRRRRLLFVAAALAALALLGTLAGWLVLSRAYFVGEHDGRVAIFTGLPQDVAGIALYRVAEETDLRTEDLPRLRRERVRDGIPVGSVGEGRRLVDGYRNELRPRAAPAATSNPTASPSPSP